MANENENLLDFILVYNIDADDSKYFLKRTIIDTYLRNLYSMGFTIEHQASTWNKNIIFVKLYAQRSMLKNFSDVYGIRLTCDNLHYSSDRSPFFKRFACKVNSILPEDPLYSRAKYLQSLSQERPKEITVAERIMIVHHMLRVTSFGPEETQHGIESLLKLNIFSDAFPLHDETVNWTDEGKLSDRQLLYKFWARANQFWKKQPLNLIEKYFGTEMAFYFAFLAHYTFCFLAPVALLGLLCFIYGLVSVTSAEKIKSFEICKSELVICPQCEFFDTCKYEKLKDHCVNAKIAFLMDNKITVSFAVLLSLWATAFMKFWKKRQARLAFRWNVWSKAVDTSERPEFEIKAKLRRVSSVTEDWESYIPRKTKYKNLFLSYSCVFFLFLVALAIVVGLMIYNNAIPLLLKLGESQFTKKNAAIIASVTSSIISVIFIVGFQNVYLRIVRKLTDLENPRTQIEYSNSYIYKQYILNFINGFSVAFYIAFFKGRFYTFPGDPAHRNRTYITSDRCSPAGCTLNLFIHLVIVMGVKSVFQNIIQILQPWFLNWWKHRWKKQKYMSSPIWEEQYMLQPLDKFYLVPEYQEIALQYGFVTFFTAAFPLAPLLALIHAIMNIRIDSFKLLKKYRRPVPVRASGLEAWEDIFQITTSIGALVNAFVIAFTLDFIPMQIMEYRTHKGFLESVLSEFNTHDYIQRDEIQHPVKCYYRGLRHGPNGGEKKYRLSLDFWFELGIRLVFVVVFKQVITVMTGIFSYAVPLVPNSIKETFHMERMQLVKEKLIDKKLAADDDLQ